MRLQPGEVRLDGKWEFVGGKMRADPVTERIELLTTKYLTKVSMDASGWETLYRDPQDGRYWELTYPQSHMHGGGPPSLVLVEKDQVKSKYNLDQPK
jgi:Immunity protein 27